MDIGFAAAALLLALIPALLFARNLTLYRPPPEVAPNDEPRPSISILIPARNEEDAIGGALQAALSSEAADVEVIVLDDHSDDDTARIVQEFAARDLRVRFVAAPPLPVGWAGKQHACHLLAGRARSELLLFVDADVRLRPRGAAEAAAFLLHSGADLVSGIPEQITKTWMEKLEIPLIHFVMLGFLPIGRMRASQLPSMSAGCGQLFLARRAAYEASGGHEAIRHTFHDGVQLPRSFRASGYRTDLFDATGVATCRLYTNAREVWHGVYKNAVEGLAAPGMIAPMSLMLLGGQTLPPLLVLLGLVGWLSPLALALAIVATLLGYFPRVAGAVRFRQSWLGVALHPVGVAIYVVAHWYALARHLLGRPAIWKGRAYREAAET